MHIFLSNKIEKKGFTLIEIIIATILISILFSVFPALLQMNGQNLKDASKINYADLHILSSDLGYDMALGKNFVNDTSNNELIVNRIDDCSITYKYDTSKEEIKKSTVCSKNENGTRTLIIPNIETFQITEVSSSLLNIKIKKINKEEIHNFNFKLN